MRPAGQWDDTARFAVVSASLLGTGYVLALMLKTQTTVLVLGAAVLYFLAVGFRATRRILHRRDVRGQGALVGACLVFLALSWTLFPFANRDLTRLNAMRREAMKTLRPALLTYRYDHGRFPAALADLVPAYTERLDPVLTNAGEEDPYRMLYYQGGRGRAVFVFWTVRGRNSLARYHVWEDRFWYKPPWPLARMFRVYPSDPVDAALSPREVAE